jgi:superfamily II DNA or RNA helicase
VYLHNLINASGGKAEHTIIQQMGRGLRCADDKAVLDYYDFIFNTNDYLTSHSNQRLDTLANEGHKITVKSSIDF